MQHSFEKPSMTEMLKLDCIHYMIFQMQVKVHLSFPSKFAGPLIGKKASNLAHIKKFSGATNIHVFPKDRDAPERYIEIIGTPLQQYFVSMFYCLVLNFMGT